MDRVTGLSANAKKHIDDTITYNSTRFNSKCELVTPSHMVPMLQRRVDDAIKNNITHVYHYGTWWKTSEASLMLEYLKDISKIQSVGNSQ